MAHKTANIKHRILCWINRFRWSIMTQKTANHQLKSAATKCSTPKSPPENLLFWDIKKRSVFYYYIDPFLRIPYILEQKIGDVQLQSSNPPILWRNFTPTCFFSNKKNAPEKDAFSQLVCTHDKDRIVHALLLSNLLQPQCAAHPSSFPPSDVIRCANGAKHTSSK